MEQIIAAHIEDFETWKTFSLLSAEIPFYKEDISDEELNLLLFNKIFYKESKGDITLINKIELEDTISLTYDSWHRMEIIPYRKGLKNGKKIVFGKSGIVSESFYENGLLNGYSFTYYSDGRIKEKEMFVNGLQEGDTYHFYRSGEVKAKISYKNDSRNGLYINYSKNGNIITKGNYINDWLEGPFYTYYETGEVHKIENFLNDRRYGEFVEYYKNGNVKSKGKYRKGLLIGPYIEYNEDGSVKLEAVY